MARAMHCRLWTRSGTWGWNRTLRVSHCTANDGQRSWQHKVGTRTVPSTTYARQYAISTAWHRRQRCDCSPRTVHRNQITEHNCGRRSSPPNSAPHWTESKTPSNRVRCCHLPPLPQSRRTASPPANSRAFHNHSIATKWHCDTSITAPLHRSILCCADCLTREWLLHVDTSQPHHNHHRRSNHSHCRRDSHSPLLQRHNRHKQWQRQRRRHKFSSPLHDNAVRRLHGLTAADRSRGAGPCIRCVAAMNCRTHGTTTVR